MSSPEPRTEGQKSPRTHSRSRSPRVRAPPTPGYFRPPDSPLETDSGPRRVSFGLPPATPAAERDGPPRTSPLKSPSSPAWFHPGEPPVAPSPFTPAPQTPLSPAAEQELQRLAQGIGNVRTRGALVLARCLVSSVLANVEELRQLRRAQMRREKLRQQEASAPALDMDRVLAMEGDEDGAAESEGVAPAADAPLEVEKNAGAKVLEVLQTLEHEVAGPSTQAQLSISGAGKEVAWFMNHALDGAVGDRAKALVQRWRADVAKGKAPVTVATLATELEQAVFESGGLEERSHKKYYARIRELAGNLRHAPTARRDLLEKKVQASECVQWPKENWWSEERRAKFQQEQAQAAKKVIVRTSEDEFYESTLKCPECGNIGGRRQVLNEYGGWEGNRVYKNTCDKCHHEWQDSV